MCASSCRPVVCIYIYVQSINAPTRFISPQHPPPLDDVRDMHLHTEVLLSAATHEAREAGTIEIEREI